MARRLFFLALLMAAPAAPTIAKPTPPTIEQLAEFPAASSFTLSPDGKHMAALQARGETRVILVWDTDALSKAPTVIGSKSMKIAAVAFVKNDVLSVRLWQPLDIHVDRVISTFVNKLFLTDLQGKDWREPLPQPTATSRDQDLEQALTNPSVLDPLVNDPDHILLVNNLHMGSGDVYRVNVRTGASERVQRGEDGVADYVTDLEGKVRARALLVIGDEGAYVAAQLRNPVSGAWEEHFRSYAKDRDETRILGFSKDPNIAFVLSNVGRDKAAIYEYDIAARKKTEVLFEHALFDATGLTLEGHKGASFGEVDSVEYAGPRGDDTQWTHPALQARDAAIRAALAIDRQPLAVTDPATGKTATIAYDSHRYYDILAYAGMNTVVIGVEGPDAPQTIYLLRDGKLSLLAKAHPTIDAASLGQTSFVSYKARDGLDIPAFLTTPNADLCGPGPWRAVVHPHGGPWGRDAMRWDWSGWVPLMASRCIAVLRPQFRGSAEWGRRLWMAGDAEWGQKMQDDKDDGARWLVATGVAQPGHIGIFGFSYGGYAAMAASVRSGGPFKCAISGAGVSDIHKIWRDFYQNPFYREGQGKTVKGLNPVDHADKLTMPILVYYGDRDTTVPPPQAEAFIARARGAKQPIEFHEFKDYAHGPAWTRQTFGEQLKLIDDWWAKGCGGGGL